MPGPTRQDAYALRQIAEEKRLAEELGLKE
jgi:hypothetical protein